MEKSFLTITLFILFNTNVYSQAYWELIRNENDIEVYFRAEENSDFVELKTSTSIETDLETLICVITDFENFPNWSYGALESYKISSISDKEFIYYIHSDMPWPVSDRECVIKLRISKLANNKLTTQSVSIKGYIEENEDCTRIYDLIGIWTFEIIDETTVNLTYYIRLNPGAGIPEWIIKMAADTAPFNTLTNLKEEVNKEEFKNCAFDLE
jgi:hypothetical protein